MSLHPEIFFGLLLAGYIINLVKHRPWTKERLLRTAPSVTLFATLLYGPLTLIGTPLAGGAAFLAIVLTDTTLVKLISHQDEPVVTSSR